MKTPHIMIVDDETDLLFSLDLLLRSTGNTVTTCVNGKEALVKIIESHENGIAIDLILTDIKMPVMNGWELIQTLRQLKYRIPILLFSGMGEQDISHEMAYIEKPFSPEDLLDRVHTILEKSGVLAV